MLKYGFFFGRSPRILKLQTYHWTLAGNSSTRKNFYAVVLIEIENIRDEAWLKR